MFEMFETVFVKDKNVEGTIVDISKINGETSYIVESNEKGKKKDGYGGVWPLFDCKEYELRKMNMGEHRLRENADIL